MADGRVVGGNEKSRPDEEAALLSMVHPVSVLVD